MSTIAPIDPATAEPAVKSTLDAVHNALGVTPNLFRVVANSPAALAFYTRGDAALGRAKLSPALRESIALATAQANACDYCLSAHTVLGKGAGLAQSDVDRARLGKAGDAHAQAVLELATEIVRERGQIAAGSLDRAHRAGVTDAEVIEIIATVAINVFTNYVNNVAGTEIDFPAVHAADVLVTA